MNPKREAERRWGAAAWLKRFKRGARELRYQVGKLVEHNGKKYVAVLGRGASWEEAFAAVDAKERPRAAPEHPGVIASADPRERP